MARDSQPTWLDRLYLPAYATKEAAQYARTSVSTVTRWFYGDGGTRRILAPKEARVPLSYLQLVEVGMVAMLRRVGVPMNRIRRAREFAVQTLDLEYPFTDIRWRTEGHHLILHLSDLEHDDALRRLVVADAGGQLAWEEMVGLWFLEFDYDAKTGLAIAWHVAGRDSKILLDPRIAFGAPQIRGIPTWAIKGRSVAGMSIQEIAEDYGISEEDVREALTFEEPRGKIRAAA